MPRTLTVREVRDAVYRAAGGPASTGGGAPSTPLFGKWFHEIFALVLSPDRALGFASVLADAPRENGEWARRLETHVYRRILGPRLSAHQAHLQESGDAVLALWRAVSELCRWLAGILEETASHPNKLDAATERELTWEISDPAWNESVIVSGVVDAVLRRPHDGRWCALELKLGQTAPEADLGQACLYHQMLSAAGTASANGSGGDMALVSFRPECHERVVSASELGAASEALKQLIGALAGVERKPVLPAQTSAPATARAPFGGAAFASPAETGAASPARMYDELGQCLLKVFREFSAPVRMDGPPVVGPAFIRFSVIPEKGVPVKKVLAQTDNVQNRLNLAAAPFIAMSQGKLAVDVQRADRQILPFASIRAQLGSGDPILGGSRVPLGVDLEGRLACADLSQPANSHILAAGTTGSGKSEWLRCAIAGLIATNTPNTLRLVLIDPKRNAFSALKGSPFLFNAASLVFPDETDPADVLDRLIDEMELRYRLFERYRADDLPAFLRIAQQSKPRIVCVCDEYADLISRSKAQRLAIEDRLSRLGNKARASGIHLILATQHPSRDVVRGALSANMPCRVGLKMAKSIESHILLDESGAENLLGNGDLLFKDVGETRR